MAPQQQGPPKRYVAESLLLALHAEIVEYNLRGPGARFYDAPSPSAGATTASPDGRPDSGQQAQERPHFLPAYTAPNLQPPPNASASAPPILSAKRHRLEALGHNVGSRLAEQHAHFRDSLTDDLEMVKFVCKDFWDATFCKHIDVLRTNHRGLYVLTDNSFRWLAAVAPTEGHEGSPEDFIVFPCGIVCGALTRLGLPCRVTADLFESKTGYRCSFNVQMISSAQ